MGGAYKKKQKPVAKEMTQEEKLSRQSSNDVSEFLRANFPKTKKFIPQKIGIDLKNLVPGKKENEIPSSVILASYGRMPVHIPEKQELVQRLENDYARMLVLEKKREADDLAQIKSKKPKKGKIIISKKTYMKDGDPLLVICGNMQKSFFVEKKDGIIGIIKEFDISTGKSGFGNEQGSNKTPLGPLEISEIAGAGKPIGAKYPFSAKAKIVPIKKEREYFADENGYSAILPKEMLTTRVLKLNGLEKENPKGQKPSNSTAAERGVYLHGTNIEYLIGYAESHGCPRFMNEDIVWLAEHMKKGSKVFIEFDGSPAPPPAYLAEKKKQE